MAERRETELTRDPDDRITNETQSQNNTIKSPASPGARLSPQHPGQTPDRSTVPGQYATRVTRPRAVRRPLTQYGTAEEIMRVFRRKPPAELTKGDFEQATAGWEELRKAYPAQLPPVRPAPGYALAHGDAVASELQAIGAPLPAPHAAVNASAFEGGAPPAPADLPAGGNRQPKDAATMMEGAKAGPTQPGQPHGLGGTLPAAKEAGPPPAPAKGDKGAQNVPQ